MDRASEHFLAGARFACDEHRDIDRCHLPGRGQQAGHLLVNVERAFEFLMGCRPEGRTVAFFAPEPFERHRRACDAGDARQGDIVTDAIRR